MAVQLNDKLAVHTPFAATIHETAKSISDMASPILPILKLY